MDEVSDLFEESEYEESEFETDQEDSLQNSWSDLSLDLDSDCYYDEDDDEYDEFDEVIALLMDELMPSLCREVGMILARRLLNLAVRVVSGGRIVPPKHFPFPEHEARKFWVSRRLTERMQQAHQQVFQAELTRGFIELASHPFIKS